jgi:hypothetical protein
MTIRRAPAYPQDSNLGPECHTAFTFKGKAVDVRSIGQDLDVRFVLEGTVRRSTKLGQTCDIVRDTNGQAPRLR